MTPPRKGRRTGERRARGRHAAKRETAAEGQASNQPATDLVAEPPISDDLAAKDGAATFVTAERQAATAAGASPIEEPRTGRSKTADHPPVEPQPADSMCVESDAAEPRSAEARPIISESVDGQSSPVEPTESQTTGGQKADSPTLVSQEMEPRMAAPEKVGSRVLESLMPERRTAAAQARIAESRPEQPPNAERDSAERRIGERRSGERAPGERQPVESRVPLKVLQGGGGLIARGVGKTYKRRPVVRNVSVSLNRGEAVGLLGPNGAGKTTTFYMIVGLVTPDTGSIHLDGADITTLPMYRRARLGIGYLPQEASVFRGLNVEQNVMAALEVVEPDLATRRLMLDELLGEFGIGHLRRTPALALSGGERRRVEIARALATQPSYILLDEPLAGIDPIAVSEIRDLVKHLKDRGIGVLITDHNVRETLEIIDRAYIMHDGQVLMEGTPNEVVANRDVRRVYLGERFSL